MKASLKWLCLVAPLIPIVAWAAGYDKDYCGGNAYLGQVDARGNVNPNKYPHLHCTKDSFTYSKSATDHLNLHDDVQRKMEGAGCKRAQRVLKEILPADWNKLSNPNDVGTAVKQFFKAECQ